MKNNISEDSIIKIIDIKRVNGNSLDNIDFSTSKGLIIPDAPITINKLNILEPITLPIAIPFWPFIEAVMLTAASGALVPNATIVSIFIIKKDLLK